MVRYRTVNGNPDSDLLQSHYLYTMNDALYLHQTEKTLRNLEAQKRRLQKEILETRQEAARIRELMEPGGCPAVLHGRSPVRPAGQDRRVG